MKSESVVRGNMEQRALDEVRERWRKRHEQESSHAGVEEPSDKRARFEEDYVPLDQEGDVTLNVHAYGAGRAERPPWIVEAGECSSLGRELLSFLNWVHPTPREVQLREDSIKRLKLVVEQTFGERASCHNIGSFYLGLYLPGSDLDFVVMGAQSAGNPLRKLASSLRNKRQVSQMQLIENSRVPIVKFTDAKTGLECDISFDMEGGIVMGHCFKRILRDDRMKHARSLVLVVKYWLRSRGLHEPFNGGMGSYSVLIVVISHLQHNCKDKNTTLEALLVSFFEFYGKKFNWITTGISILNGGEYFSKERKGGAFEDVGKPALEDPVDPSNNISRATYSIGKIREAMRSTHDALVSPIADREFGVLAKVLLGPHVERMN